MLTLLTVIGILLVLAMLIFFFTKSFISEEPTYREELIDKYEPSRGTRKVKIGDGSPPFLVKLKKSLKLQLSLLVFGILLALTSFLFFYAQQGHQYYLVYPNGAWSTVYTPGFKIRFFSRIQEWQKELDIKVVAEGEPDEGVEGIITDKVTFNYNEVITDSKGNTTSEIAKTETVPGISMTFIDRVNAAVRVSIRMRMPQDDDNFRAIAESFRDQNNLIYNTLIPTVKEQLSNSGYQFAAQDYISGAATDFRQAVDDQFKFGGYSTVRKEKMDTVYSTFQQNSKERVIREINTKYEIKKREDANGQLVRIPHEITQNNIEVIQVIIDDVYLEPAFKKRLEAQRDISAQKRIEMEKVETAKAAQQRIIAEGESVKAQERVTQEKSQITTLIAIETKVKEEESNRQLAEIQLKTALLSAQKVKVDADAKAYELQRADGLSEEVKAVLENDLKKTQALAEAVKEAKWPTTFINGGGDGKSNNDLLTQLIGAQLAAQMLPKK